MKALSIRGLSKQYANGVNALQQINLDVEEGDFFALLGPNGAGKSTLISILTNLIKKSEGKVFIHGHDIDIEREAANASLGVVPQEFNFNIFSPVLTVILNQAGYYGIPRRLAKERAEYLLNQLGLWDKRNTLMNQLSGGMKRRLMIARGLIHEPKMLILDEPTAGVDLEIRHSMWDFLQSINDNGVTIILTTHYLEEAEHLCRNLAIIDAGKIVEKRAMSELLGQLDEEQYVLYLQHDLHVIPHLDGCQITKIDARTIEVQLSQSMGMGITPLIAALQDAGIYVNGLKNKLNRLEQIFMKRTKH